MKLLISLARAYPGRTAVTLFALVLSGVLEGIGLTALFPVLEMFDTGDSVDSRVDAPAFLTGMLAVISAEPTVGSLLLVLAVGMWLKGLLILASKIQVGYTVARVATDLRLRLLESLLKARWAYYQRQSSGRLANAVATEAMRASEAYLQGTRMITFAVQAVVALAIATWVDWRITGLAIAGGLMVLGILMWLVRITRRAGESQTMLLRSLLSRLTDLLHSLKALKAMAREPLVASVLETETRELNRALQRQIFSKEALRSMQEPLLATLVVAGLFLAMVFLDIKIAALLGLIALLVRALLHLNKVQRLYQEMVGSESAYFAIEEAIREAQAAREEALGDSRPRLTGAIRLEGISFSYDDTPTLEGIDLEIPVNGITTIVGKSGSGKTTIVDLVAGLVRPQQGEVWLGETPMSGVDLKSWRRMLGYVPQDTLLLHDTVFQNVTLGDERIGVDDVQQALADAGALEFVSAMHDGVYTVVGEGGGRLSGGQRQRIVIARALVHHPALLVLDEATSALDDASEREIAATMARLRGHLTILAVSHRPALIDIADRVYRLESGRVVGSESPGSAD